MRSTAAIFAFIFALPALAQEQEPNNDFAQARAVSNGDVITGALTPGDQDYFTLTTAARSTIEIHTAQPQGGGRIDTVLYLFNGDHNQIARNDDDWANGRGVYSGITHADAAAGTWYFRVEGFAGRQTGPYELHINLSGGPDMAATQFTLDPVPAPNQTWGASLVVTNAAGASPATVTRLYNGEAMLAEHQTPVIAEDGTLNVSFADLAALPVGYHDLRVCVDATGLVEELNEENNCATQRVTIGIDAVAQGMVVSPNPPVVGETWSTSATIRNALAGVLPANTTTLYLNDQPSGSCAVPELADGGSHNCAFDNLAGLPSGITVVRICADSAEAIVEAAEDNNCAERRIAIGSDMIAENLSLDPINPGLNDRWSATATVSNRFAPDTPATTARLFIGDQPWGDCAVPALAEGASHQCSLSDLAPPPEGRHVVRICADAAGEWGERNEDNNCAEANIFNGPDLQIQQVVMNPDPPVEGRSAQLLAIVRNAAGDPVNNPTNVVITEGEARLGSCGIGALGANGMAACQVDNLSFAGGQHTLQVCTDGDQAQIEINEANNCSEVVFTVEDVDDFEPDNNTLSAALIRPSVPQDHTLHNDEDIDYMFFVVNRDSEAQISTSASQEGDAFNTRLALLDAEGRELTSNLNGGDGNWSRIVREVTPGTYFLRVNRGGNDAVDRYRITLRLIDLAARPPDLSPGVLTLDPPALVANQAFTISTVVTNAANAGVSQGTNGALTINGEAAGECSLPELASGATATCSILVPGGAPVGDDVLRLCIDPGNAMEERNEDNNCGSLNLHLYAADEFEDDDTIETASDGNVGGDQARTMHAGDDVDWVRLVMNEPGSITVTATVNEGSGGDVDGRLTAPGGESLGRSNEVGAVSLSYGPADRGTFLVELTARGGQPVDAYTLTVSTQPVAGEVIRDLRLMNVVVDPEQPLPDTVFEVDVDAINDGNLISSATPVALRINGEEVARCVLPPEEPTGRSRCRGVEVPGLAEGNYTLEACIDPDNELDETNEDNNCASLAVVVGEPAPPANDLRLQNFRLNPSEPVAGELITLRMEVFYTGDDSTDVNSVEIHVDGELVHTCRVPGLDGRMNRTASCRTLPGMMQMGETPQVVTACVDPNNEIDETDEDNNCARMVMAPGGFVGDDPDPYEVDDDWAHAGTINDNEAQARAQGHNLHTASDVDVMKFHLTQDDVINVRISEALGEVQVMLVDGPAAAGDAGSRMESVLTLDEDGWASSGPLTTGTYAIVVSSGNGEAVAQYRINAWTDLGPVRPDAGPAPPDAGPPGECQSHDDCTGGQRCMLDDPEPYCTNICESVTDCPEGFQLTCREVELGTKLCIRGDAPPTVNPPDPGAGCSCGAGGGAGSVMMMLSLAGLAVTRRRRGRSAE